jgi:hypothetical protein
MILKFTSAGINGGTIVTIGCGIAGGCFTDFMVRSSMSYHHEHAMATEPRRLHKDVEAACGAVMLRFHGVYKPEKY